MFRGSDCIAVRRVHNHDATCGGRRNINVVDAHAGAANDTQRRHLVHQACGYFCFAAHDQAIEVSQCRRQLIRSEANSFFDREPSCAQWLQPALADIVGHEYFVLVHKGARIIAVSISRCLVGKVVVNSSPLDSRSPQCEASRLRDLVE